MFNYLRYFLVAQRDDVAGRAFMTDGPDEDSIPFSSRDHPVAHSIRLETPARVPERSLMQSRGQTRAVPRATPMATFQARSPSAQARRPLNNSVRHFSTTWGSRGAGPGLLDTPTGLSILGDTQVNFCVLQLFPKIFELLTCVNRTFYIDSNPDLSTIR